MIHTNHLLWQASTMTEDRQREAERQLARAAARWHRRLWGARAERVGVEPTRA
ncbi:hypothetical protein [Dactylosporangium sp. NPDC000521]|uniref:hypothetical protein n=1 Tax=Dactylosporangium sp. NPDC000521 TaxID=3363975 RepID=UPI00369B22A9